MTSEETKRRMEEIWRTGGVAHPLCLVTWLDFAPERGGFSFYNAEKSGTLLWFRKGRRLAPKRLRVKGRGFSFLPDVIARRALTAISRTPNL